MPGIQSRQHLSAACLLAGGTILTLGSAVQAGPPLVHFDIQVTGGTAGFFQTDFDQAGTPTGNPQIYNYQGSMIDPNFGEWAINEWDFNADPVPSGAGVETGAKIGSVFTVMNNLPDGQDANANRLFFSILITIDLSAMPNQPTSFFGNASMTFTIDDSPNDFPGFLRAVGGPMWNYLIDGVDEAALFPDTFFMGGSDGPATESSSDNLDGAPLAGMNVSELGIRLDFDLTPGERVTFDGLFGVIPSPGSLTLLALALLVSRRRRRT